MALWSVRGESVLPGQHGEECGFGITVAEDGSVTITGWTQYAGEEAALPLTSEQIDALRQVLDEWAVSQ